MLMDDAMRADPTLWQVREDLDRGVKGLAAEGID